MHEMPAHGGATGASDAEVTPQASALLLLAAIQRGEGADSVRARLASLLPPPLHRAGWATWLGHLLHAALDRSDDPGVLAALLEHGAVEEPSPAAVGGGGGLAPPTALGLSPMLQQLLTAALQRGSPEVVGAVLRHCGGDPDMPLPAFPSGMLAFSCYTGNLPLIAALLHWGADHQRALDLLSPPAAVGIRWDAGGVALLRRAQRAFLLHKLRLLRKYARRGLRAAGGPGSEERVASAMLDARMVVAQTGGSGGGRRAALPAVELMPLEARLEEQLRIGGGTEPAPASAVGRVPAVLEYTVDGMPLAAFRRLVRMMGDF